MTEQNNLQQPGEMGQGIKEYSGLEQNETKEKEPIGNEIVEEYEGVVAEIHEPMGHGTTLEALTDIMGEGLGGKTVEDASDDKISLIDLSQPDGLLGATIFATRGDAASLAIDASAQGIGTMAERYARLNPRISAESLDRQLEVYRQRRAKSAGVPAILIYEGEGLSLYQNNPSVTSERLSRESVPASALRAVMVPAESRERVESLLINSEIKVLSIEVEELMALKQARKVP